MIKSVGPFPRRTITRLKYSANYVVTSSGTVTTQVWNLNGLYDPDSTGVGHQPYGYDQWMDLYSRYRVYKAKWYVSIGSSNASAIHCVLPYNGTDPAYTTISAYTELPYASVKTTGSNGSPSAVFKGSSYLPALNGSTVVSYKSDDRFTGTSGTNPTEKMLLIYICKGATTDTQFIVNATITYHVEFFDPNDFGQS